MKTFPLVTIGIPTYNRPKGLKRALYSVVNQTYQNLEIIVSDNFSTDKDIEKVIHEFQSDERVIFVRQIENKGFIKNFNFLVDAATGDYFMWLADDDWLDLNYVELCLDFLMKNFEYAAAYGSTRIYTYDEKFIGIEPKIDLSQDSGRGRVKFYLENIIYNGCFTALVRKAFKSQLVMDDIIAIDWLVVSRISYLGKYKLLETTNCHISQGGLSSSIENLTRNMPEFARSFPYLAISLNFVVDIMWGSATYNKIGIFNKFSFAKECFLIVYKRFNVKAQLKPGLKEYINHKSEKFRKLIRIVKNKVSRTA